MLDLLGYIYDSLDFFFTSIYQFLTGGIYSFAQWAFAQFIEKSTLAFLDFVLWAIPFAWGTAKNIMNDIGLSQLLTNAWSSLDSNVLGFLTAFRVPDCLNILISAFFTRYVLRFIPFV